MCAFSLSLHYGFVIGGRNDNWNFKATVLGEFSFQLCSDLQNEKMSFDYV